MEVVKEPGKRPSTKLILEDREGGAPCGIPAPLRNLMPGWPLVVPESKDSGRENERPRFAPGWP